MGLKMKGHIKTVNSFGRLIKNLPDGVERGLEKSVRYLYVQTQIQVPRDTEALALTAVTGVSGVGSSREGHITYGQPGEGEGIVDYAAAVHEILKASHAPPTKAKYVEDPLFAGKNEYERFIGDSCQSTVRRSFR